MKLSKIIRRPVGILIRLLAARSPRFSAWFGRFLVNRAFDRKMREWGFVKKSAVKWVRDY